MALRPHHAATLGRGSLAGRIPKDALAFLQDHQDARSETLVAYFLVRLTMQDAAEENRRERETDADETRWKAPHMQPIDVGLFAGRQDCMSVAFPLRLILKATFENETRPKPG